MMPLLHLAREELPSCSRSACDGFAVTVPPISGISVFVASGPAAAHVSMLSACFFTSASVSKFMPLGAPWRLVDAPE